MNKTISLRQGYSLIELLVVISIMSIIGVVTVVSFVSFNNTQIIDSAAADVGNFYILARQGALSQVKPSQCTSVQSLRSYQVVLSIAARTYRINALCGNSSFVIRTKTLPTNVTFANTSPTTVQFNVPNANISTQSTVTINGYGKTKTIVISSSGAISIN